MTEPVRLRIKVLDIVVEVRLHGDATEAEVPLTRAWARCLADVDAAVVSHIDVELDPGSAPRRSHTQVVAPTIEALGELLTQAITLAGIRAGAGDLLMFHAAGLVHAESRRGVLLVGPSGMGKSTAARHLGREWGYLSDETMAVRPEGTMIAYPKPLSLREGGRWKRQVGPDDLGLAGTLDLVVPAGVVLLDRGDHSSHGLTPLPLTESVAALAEHTSHLAKLDRPLHRIADLVKTAGCARVSYTTTDQLHAAVSDVMQGRLLCG